MIVVFVFILGLFVGSFLNVVAGRYNPEHSFFEAKSILGRSRCPHCGTTLKWYELIPIFSFIFLTALSAFASEADLAIPDLHKGAPYTLLGGT